MLIEDTLPLIFQLHESETVNGSRKLRGLFHLAETKNANGRIYPKKILEREVRSIMPSIKDRRILGELDHPTDPRIHLDKSSHVITNLKMEGNKVFGELEALKTPAGRILEGLIDSGVKLGISSRGLGSLREDKDAKYVQEDYALVTWDIVPNPSTPGSWLGESASNSSGDPIIIHIDNEIVTESELDLVEFGGQNQNFGEYNKINLDSLIKQKVDEIFSEDN